MTDFLLELLTEEIPARMQAAAIEQLKVRFGDGAKGARLPVARIDGYVTPRRLVIYATGVGAEGDVVSDERRGPRVDAPEQAIAGFVKSTGLARADMEERETPKGRFLYATIVTPGRSAAAIVAALIPAIVRDFDWPKSMRWGDASISTASPRWVRPLSGIVALLGDAVVPFPAAGITSGRTTVGHRFMSSGRIEITSAATYVDQLREAHVMLDSDERRAIILDGAQAAASATGLTLIPDDGLVAENAGLTEWPVPLLGHFDPAFLDVPREVIQLTMRTNQKYFACVDADGALAPAFVCVANIAADDGGAAIVAGNQKVLAARLSDAKFFWDADRAVTLESRLPKLADIVFHEKLGTVAEKVERVAKLARWLVESGAVPGADPQMAETAARLCKADLVSATVGEFPEVQGIAGGHLALAEGQPPEVAAAIRDHYKPVGPSDDVPIAPVTVAVALADKLDTLVSFFVIDEIPTGSRDPFALRRAALGIVRILVSVDLRLPMINVVKEVCSNLLTSANQRAHSSLDEANASLNRLSAWFEMKKTAKKMEFEFNSEPPSLGTLALKSGLSLISDFRKADINLMAGRLVEMVDFLADRLKVQQREAGVRPDIIDAVFALGGEDDLVRLLARVKALQAVLQTPDGASLLAGYKRGANMLRIEEVKDGLIDGAVDADLLSEPAEIGLNAALDAAVPEVAAAVADERFESAMTALARLRPMVDAFFDTVTVNAGEQAVRRNRLALLARLRTAVHSVADFSKINE